MTLLSLGLRGRRVVFLLCWPQVRPSEDGGASCGRGQDKPHQSTLGSSESPGGGLPRPRELSWAGEGEAVFSEAPGRASSPAPAPHPRLPPPQLEEPVQGSPQSVWAGVAAPGAHTSIHPGKAHPGSTACPAPGRPGARATCRVKGSCFRRVRHRQTRKSRLRGTMRSAGTQEWEPQTPRWQRLWKLNTEETRGEGDLPDETSSQKGREDRLCKGMGA